jgi:hypothetical protein
MRQDLENNRDPEEFKSSKEFNKDPKEERFAKEYISAAESDDLNKEYPVETKVQRIKRDAASGGKLATGAAVVGVASLIVIGTSGLVNINMDGRIEKLEFQDNHIVYEVNVSDVEKGNTMYFEIYEGTAPNALTTKEIITHVEETINVPYSGILDTLDLNIEEKLKTKDSVSFTFRLCGNTGLVNRTYDSMILEVN